MQQEDYLKLQIDQLGRVLGKILSDLLGLKSRGEVTEGIGTADRSLKFELDLSIEELISIPSGEFIKTLQKIKGLSHDNFGKLADILFVFAEALDKTGNVNRDKLFERSLAILKYLDNTSTIYSFERHAKIEKIRNLIQRT